MSPRIPSQPVVGIILELVGLFAFFVPQVFLLVFGQKYWPENSTRKKLLPSFILSLLLSPMVGWSLSIPLAIGVLTSVDFVIGDSLHFFLIEHLTIPSIFLIWILFSLLVGWVMVMLLLGIFYKKIISLRLVKVGALVSLAAFVFFVSVAFGINKLHDYYKYCPEKFICKRAPSYTYYPPPVVSPTQQPATPFVQGASVGTKTTITSLANGSVLVPANGYVEIAGTAEPGKYMLLSLGFKNPEEWRFGKEQSTFTLDYPVQVASDGRFSILLKESVIPKGDVYIAAFTLGDSDVPWASVYNAAIVKVTHK